MEPPFSPEITVKPRILIAPLDWGLGHATRCIPIIRELLAQGANVWLAGEGAQEQLLREEFPALPFVPLPGYRIRYAKTSAGLIWKMMQQIPKMKKAIRAEHEWLMQAIEKYQFDAVISDNRYGLYHPAIPCIFMTHQLLIKSSIGAWSEKLLQHQNYRYINRFTSCWIPDAEGTENLAGELSHPAALPEIPVVYTGPLSRLCITENTSGPVAVVPGRLLIILSGPEPQRSLLEEQIIEDIAHYPGTATIVRGLPGDKGIIPSTNMISFHNHLPAAALQQEFAAAEFIISRSGYSTVMDIMALHKKSILIPTPGQTEQEYLGKYLEEKGMAVCVQQRGFSLQQALNKAQQFRYTLKLPADNKIKEVVRDFLTVLTTQNMAKS